MQNIHHILKQYWGYDAFRPMQEDIIQAALDGKDSLALLPTGGGKSICFQVPALAQEGICIVVSPLIALMKDQVKNLNDRNIKAAAIFSGMSIKEIDILLDNCIYGNMKFLYVSPERLTTDLFIARFKQMNVNLIAIDEAHCISQWGYDFRPPYLKIADIKPLFPKVPMLALTATATPEVVIDIQEKLNFKTPHVFQQSFERKNLHYLVLKEEDKYNRLIKILNKIKGTAVVYARNRRKTQEIAHFLQQHQISADYYHAGLENPVRDKKQLEWITNKTRVIVATNAFGMGIDKPDVRLVVHMDLADSLEAYFQEAGRGGRDGKTAYAVQLLANSDITIFKERIENSFPNLDTIKSIYNSIFNYYKIGVGAGKEEIRVFNISDFATKFKYRILIIYNALKYIEMEGYISLTDAVYNPSRIKFIADKAVLYAQQNKDKKLDHFTKILLRSFSGIFDNYVKIRENEIAKRSDFTYKEVVYFLQILHQQKIIRYIPQNNDPKIFFVEERLDDKNFILSKKNYLTRKKVAFERMDAVINYVTENKCRSKMLLAYFGDTNTNNCNNCDNCLKAKNEDLTPVEFETIKKEIHQLLTNQKLIAKDLINKLALTYFEQKIIKTIRVLIDNEELVESNNFLSLP